MPIRILHIVTYMGRGGLETMLMNYYRNIDRERIQFDFLTHRSFEADYDKEIESLGGKIYHLPKLNPFSKKYLKKLDTFFREHPEYKIVHSHLDCMSGIPLKIAKKNGVPVRIAHAHSTSQEKNLKYFLKLLYKRMIPRYATKLLACSEAAGSWMFKGAEFEVLYNAIDAQQYRYDENVRKQVRKAFGITEKTLVVGHVGRFSPPKNHAFLIEIFCDIVKRRPDSKLLLVGDGVLRKDIEKKCHDHAIWDKVIFTGLRGDVPDLLQAMDVFAFPSLYEGLPLVIVEAQASGLPCIISDKVPIECKKTEGLIRQVKLQESTEYWAQQLIELASVERKDTLSEIRKSGFDVRENVRKLENMYLSLCNY